MTLDDLLSGLGLDTAIFIDTDEIEHAIKLTDLNLDDLGSIEAAGERSLKSGDQVVKVPVYRDKASKEDVEKQMARSKQYGIGKKAGGAVTMPSEWKSKGATDDDFLDPVNYRYPCPDADQTRAAASYWGQADNKKQYSAKEQGIIDDRLAAKKKKFKIGDEAPASKKGSDGVTVPNAFPSDIPDHAALKSARVYLEHKGADHSDLERAMMARVVEFAAKLLGPESVKPKDVMDMLSSADVPSWQQDSMDVWDVLDRAWDAFLSACRGLDAMADATNTSGILVDWDTLRAQLDSTLDAIYTASGEDEEFGAKAAQVREKAAVLRIVKAGLADAPFWLAARSIKAGARHSNSDKAMIGSIHDNAAKLEPSVCPANASDAKGANTKAAELQSENDRLSSELATVKEAATIAESELTTVKAKAVEHEQAVNAQRVELEELRTKLASTPGYDPLGHDDGQGHSNPARVFKGVPASSLGSGAYARETLANYEYHRSGE